MGGGAATVADSALTASAPSLQRPSGACVPCSYTRGAVPATPVEIVLGKICQAIRVISQQTLDIDHCLSDGIPIQCDVMHLFADFGVQSDGLCDACLPHLHADSQ